MIPTQPNPRPFTSRRTFLGLAAGAALVPVGVSGGAADAAPRRAVPAPETVPLPDGFRPEGITSGPGTTYYAGSMADGSLVKGDLISTQRSVLVQPMATRAIRGLFYKGGVVWAAGNVGKVQYAWAFGAADGSVLYAQQAPDGGFHNDVVVTATAAYVTDSRVDRLLRIPVDSTGRPTGVKGTFVPIRGEWPAGDGVANNANGIRELPDGNLVLNNSRVGGLWQVDPATGFTTQIPVKGGPGITGGDGLERDGNVLYNVRGSGQNQVSVLLLTQTTSGWTAKWAGARTDETLDFPSTATVAGGWLWAVNARFSTPATPTTPYWITRLPAR